MSRMMFPSMLVALITCAPSARAQQSGCAGVPDEFMDHLRASLSDSLDRFKHDYPPVTPLTCELLILIHDAQNDDSLSHHIEHLHGRYGDLRASKAFSYIERQKDFLLPVALLTHWNPDVRIGALRALQEYRRLRPLVCTTQEGNAKLESQDRAAVRYLIRVLETTPLGINGSENSTIHDIYMRTVMEALDLFTGHDPRKGPDSMINVPRTGPELQQAMQGWRKWLEE